MLALLALTLAVPGPLDTPITYESDSTRLDSAMAAIGKQAGIEIKVQGAPERDYVYVNISNRPLGATLDLFAKVCDASWRVDAGQVIFSAPAAQVGEHPDYAQRVSAIQRWLNENPVPAKLDESNVREFVEKILVLESRSPRTTEIQANLDQMRWGLPAHRVHLKLLHTLGAEEIARTAPGERVLSMNEGRGRIRQLTPEVQKVFKSIANEYNDFADLLTSKGLIQVIEQSETSSCLREFVYARPLRLDQYFLQLRTSEFSASSSITLLGDGRHGSGHLGDTASIPFPKLEASEASRDLLATFSTMLVVPESWNDLRSVSQSREWPPIPSPTLLERILNLDRDEVLTDYADDVFRQLSESKNKDVIAIIPDSAYMLVPSLMAQSGTLGEAVARIFSSQYSAEEVEGAFLMKSLSNRRVRQDRIPRPEAARLIREIHKTGRPSLDDLVDVAQASDSLSVENTLFIADRTFGFVRSHRNQSNILRAFGLLPHHQQREAQESYVTLEYGKLTKAMRAEIDALLASNLLRAPLEASPGQPAAIGDIHDSANFLAPFGIPDQATLSFAVTREQLPHIFQDWDWRPEPTTHAALAERIVFNEKAGGTRAAYPRRIAYVEVSRLHVWVSMPNGAAFRADVPIYGASHLTKFGKYEDMPEDFHAQMESAMQSAREKWKNTMFGPPTRSNTPTPQGEPSC